jgi:hypothetical protein
MNICVHLRANRKTLLFGFFFSFLVQGAKAQTQRQSGTNHNAWFSYTGAHNVNEHWGIHVEGQFRRSDFLNQWQQILLRTGINYHLNSSILFTAGYAFAKTYPYGVYPSGSAFPENRFWQQIQVRTPVQKLEWIGRLRTEQRFVNQPVKQADGEFNPGDAVHTNRFRLMNRLSIPLNSQKLEPGSTYLSISDEVFINSGKNVGMNVLDQNRAIVSLGHVIDRLGRIELGFMFHDVLKPDGIRIEHNNTLLLGLSSNLNWYKKKA